MMVTTVSHSKVEKLEEAEDAGIYFWVVNVNMQLWKAP